MKTIIMSVLKSRLAKMLVQIEKEGKAVRVILRGRPLVDISPVRRRNGMRVLGGMRGTVAVRGEIVHTDSSSDWTMCSDLPSVLKRVARPS
jgi:antitoxin (DNA-binding transcriptional repressor) of toxin-antitoxin stability system